MKQLGASDCIHVLLLYFGVPHKYRNLGLPSLMLSSVRHPSFTSSIMAGHAFLFTFLLLPIMSYCALRMLFKYLDYRVRHVWLLLFLMI